MALLCRFCCHYLRCKSLLTSVHSYHALRLHKFGVVVSNQRQNQPRMLAVLQAIGLSLDSALAFWRSEFAKGGMTDDKFKKEHHYGIRHSYGKEGKRVDYTPASCINVIMSNPQAVRCIPT